MRIKAAFELHTEQGHTLHERDVLVAGSGTAIHFPTENWIGYSRYPYAQEKHLFATT